MKNNSGFTLVELSIVLVIMGILAAGILTGQGLIHGARMRGVISDYSKYQGAIGIFLVKYDEIPGDMPNAEAYWGSDTDCPNPSADSVT